MVISVEPFEHINGNMDLALDATTERAAATSSTNKYLRYPMRSSQATADKAKVSELSTSRSIIYRQIHALRTVPCNELRHPQHRASMRASLRSPSTGFAVARKRGLLER